jgi:hypothetical protein
MLGHYPENIKSEWLNIMGMPPNEYLAERVVWMDLLGWDLYRKLLDVDSTLLVEPKLAQDYAFYINYFTNVPYFYSKGGAVTVAPEDIPGMAETMEKILQHFEKEHPIYTKLDGIKNYACNILGRSKKILRIGVCRGDRTDLKAFSNVCGKGDFQNERKELDKKKADILQERARGISKAVKNQDADPILNSDDKIETNLNEIQEILNSLSSIAKTGLIAEKIKNAAIIVGTTAVSLSTPPQIPNVPLNIACFVELQPSLFDIFKMRHENIDVGRMVVYMRDKDVAKKEISRIFRIGNITRGERTVVLENLSSAFLKQTG